MNCEDNMIEILNRAIHENKRYRMIVFASHAPDIRLEVNMMVLWESAQEGIQLKLMSESCDSAVAFHKSEICLHFPEPVETVEGTSGEFIQVINH